MPRHGRLPLLLRRGHPQPERQALRLGRAALLAGMRQPILAAGAPSARLVQWIGQTVGLAQWRWAGRRFDGIPWTPLRRPIAEATVALPDTGGVHLRADRAFDLDDDPSF